MKKRTLIYSIMALAALALSAVVISDVTDTRSMQPPPQQGQTEVTTLAKTRTLAAKKKSCGCCAKRIARARELMQKARERRMAARDSISQQTPSDVSNTP